MITPASDNSDSASWPEWKCPGHLEVLDESCGELICPGGCRYAVKEDIPRFISSTSYADAFGAQWKRYRLTQLDSYTGVGISERRVRRNVGEELWGQLEGRHVLEAGCGAGRFTEILLHRGAFVTSIDLSEAVDANVCNFPVGGKHRVAQADILSLPFGPRSFDVAFCLGVIQHTPDPTLAITRLFDQVKPGGWLIIDQYTYHLSRHTKTAPLFRAVLRRVDPETGVKATEGLVDLFLPLHKAMRDVRFGQMLLSRLSPVQAYYQAYPELSDDVLREWALLDTHDALTDWHRHFSTARQTRRLLERLGAEIIRCERQGYVVEARARRPASRFLS